MFFVVVASIILSILTHMLCSPVLVFWFVWIYSCEGKRTDHFHFRESRPVDVTLWIFRQKRRALVSSVCVRNGFRRMFHRESDKKMKWNECGIAHRLLCICVHTTRENVVYFRKTQLNISYMFRDIYVYNIHIDTIFVLNSVCNKWEGDWFEFNASWLKLSIGRLKRTVNITHQLTHVLVCVLNIIMVLNMNATYICPLQIQIPIRL